MMMMWHKPQASKGTSYLFFKPVKNIYRKGQEKAHDDNKMCLALGY